MTSFYFCTLNPVRPIDKCVCSLMQAMSLSTITHVSIQVAGYIIDPYIDRVLVWDAAKYVTRRDATRMYRAEISDHHPPVDFSDCGGVDGINFCKRILTFGRYDDSTDCVSMAIDMLYLLGLPRPRYLVFPGQLYRYCQSRFHMEDMR